jgi:N-acetylglucosamine-6-sulfatase
MDMDYRAIRTERYKYIHWMQYPDWGELYDLRVDPFEARNLMGEPGMEAVFEGLKEELRASVLHAMGLSG